MMVSGGAIIDHEFCEFVTGSAIATINEQPVDGWDAAAGDLSASPVKGSLVKFDAGQFFLGKERTPIAADRGFVALDTAEGWQYLKKGAPPEFSMRRLGGPKPPRPDSYTDAGAWPLGLNGEPEDPWKYTRYLYLVDPLSAETFSFASSSFDGERGIGDLTSQIQLMRNARPGAVPVITLASRMMPTRFGPKPRPFFQVQSWRVRGGDEPKLLIEHVDDNVETVNALDDEIPF
jgi:hypothetical protein